jgi:hypothetical protein
MHKPTSWPLIMTDHVGLSTLLLQLFEHISLLGSDNVHREEIAVVVFP